MVKSCLVAIAKDEDKYIDEWLSYHLKVGFDRIILIRNNWKYEPKVVDDRITIIDDDSNDRTTQNRAYNRIIQEHCKDFEWIAFWDIDEFLVLKKAKNINEFLDDYEEYAAVGVNWRMFGDSNITYDPRNNSVIDRFIMCGKSIHDGIKTIVHTKKTDCHVIMYTHHALTPIGRTVNVSKKNYINGTSNWNDLEEIKGIAYLNHYRNKTKFECMEKCIRNDRGFDIGMNYVDHFQSEFDRHNINEDYDYSASDFFHDKCLEEK